MRRSGRVPIVNTPSTGNNARTRGPKQRCAARRLRLARILAAVAAAVALIASAAWASAAGGKPGTSPHGRVVVVLVDYTSVEDFWEDSAWRDMLERFAAGLLVARTGAPALVAGRGNAYATVGAGDKATLSNELAGRIFGASEWVADEGFLARDLYRQRCGQRPDGEIVAVSYPGIAREFDDQDIITGGLVLGERLRRRGVPVCALGNADTQAGVDRAAALAVLDARGVAEAGVIDRSVTTVDPGFPGGLVTDYGRLLSLVERFLEDSPRSGFVWIDTGDMARIEAFRDQLDDRQYIKLRRSALRRAERFVGNLCDALDFRRDTLLVVSAVPSADRIASGTNITCLLARGPRFRPGSLLSSAATRTDGLVTLSDLTATLLWLAKDSEGAALVSGEPISDTGKLDAKRDEHLLELDAKLAAVSASRASVLTGYVALVIVGIGTAGLCILFAGRSAPFPVVQRLLFMLAAFPAATLLTSPFYALGPVIPTLSATVVALLAALLAPRLLGRPLWRAYVALGGAVAAALALDAAANSTLARFSPLGYSPVIGARFYGIGNEFMGLLVGGALLCWGALIGVSDRLRRQKGSRSRAARAAALVLAVACPVVVGHPALGANVGGALTAVVAFAFAWLYRRRRSIGISEVLLSMGVLALGLGLLVLVSFEFPSFHLARLVRQVLAGDWAVVGNIAVRKIAMNLKLLRYTIWSDALLAMIVVFPAVTLHPPGLLASALARLGPQGAAIVGAGFGAVAAFLLNDSGVVAAATLLMVPALGVLSTLLEEKERGARAPISD